MSRIFSDCYTTPLRCKSKLRTPHASSAGSPERTSPELQASRRRLLDRLASNIRQEDEKVEALLIAFDLAADDVESGQPYARNSSPGTEDERAAEHGDSPLGGTGTFYYGKELYLYTPVRLKYFPNLSPTILRRLLSTPPTRIYSPDSSYGEEDIFVSALETSVSLEKSTEGRLLLEADPREGTHLELEHRAVPMPVGPSAGPFAQSACLSLELNSCYLPTPPPSSEFPAVSAFAAVDDGSSELAGQGQLWTIRPSLDGRSSQDVRSPLSTTSHRGLRTSQSDLHALTQRKSMANLTMALQQHAHTGLSAGALRNFHRVMDELRGSRVDSNEADDYIVEPSTGQTEHPASPSAAQVSTVPDEGHRGFTARILDGGSSSGSAPFEGSPPAWHLRCSPALSLKDEMTALLFTQATEEELHADELIALAEGLKRTSRRRRQLAIATAAKVL